MADPPPETLEIDWSQVPAQVLDEWKDQVLVALLRRLGGKADIPVKELDEAAKFVFGYSITVPAAPTGELKLDARIHGAFHFELRRKQ
jgi:hypothetical protein